MTVAGEGIVPAIPCGRRWPAGQNLIAGDDDGLDHRDRRLRSTGEDKPSPLPIGRKAWVHSKGNYGSEFHGIANADCL
jgi:hypothetical protein